MAKAAAAVEMAEAVWAPGLETGTAGAPLTAIAGAAAAVVEEAAVEEIKKINQQKKRP